MVYLLFLAISVLVLILITHLVGLYFPQASLLVRHQCSYCQFPFKTGDLLLCSSNSPKDKFLCSVKRKWCGLENEIIAGHLAVVWVHPTSHMVYVWEMLFNGPTLRSIHNLNWQKYSYFVKPINKALSSEKVKNVINVQYNYRYNKHFLLHFLMAPYFLRTNEHYKKGLELDATRHCSAFAYELYMNEGVFPCVNNVNLVFPGTFLNTIPKNGYAFGDLVELKK